jgi:hypothetical protein
MNQNSTFTRRHCRQQEKQRALTTFIRSVIVIACLCCTIGTNDLYGQWSTNPSVNNAICTQPNDQAGPQIVSDGAGGAIITWIDRRSGVDDIYAQRIDAGGVVQWTTDGVVICNATFTQSNPKIVTDGAGGAIITWTDDRDGLNVHIYAQRINGAGAVQWAANGVPICLAANSQASIEMASDGAGGAIICWRDRRTAAGPKGGDLNIYAQRVNASGVVQWTVDGVAICIDAATQDNPAIVSDGAGGAILAWDDYRNTNIDVFAQRVDGTGVVQWTTNGIPIGSTTNDQQFAVSVSDGSGGAIITWIDDRSGNVDLYAQQVNSTGVVGWTTNGVTVCSAANASHSQNIISDNAGGAVITWNDFRSDANGDIYAQWINSSGVNQWGVNGNVVADGITEQRLPTIASDGSGGGIISWYGSGAGSIDIYAQRINAFGSLQWPSGIVCNASGNQFSPHIVESNTGGAIMTWTDGRNVTNGGDIYAQRITGNGELGCAPATLTTQPETFQSVCQNSEAGLFIHLTGTGPFTFQWYSNTSNSNVGGTALPGKVKASMAVPTDVTGTFYYYVIVTNACGADTSDVAVVQVNALLISHTQTNVNCDNPLAGSIDLSVSGGTPPYTYAWTGPGGVNATIQDLSGLSAGTYDVTVTDAMGCTSSYSVEILDTGLNVNAGPDTNLCNSPVLLTGIVSNAVTSGPPPPTPFAEVAGSTADKRIFTGNIEYVAIGNTFSKSEDRTNCGKNATSSQILTLPAGAVVKKAYLYWSGSGLTDNQVKLNGVSVTADNTKSHYRPLLFLYFAARKDVTSLVAGSGVYTVSELNWSNNFPYCFDNSAYGAWSLVVIYEQASLPAARIHVNTEKFKFTYPAGNYSTTIDNIAVPESCSSDARLTIVGFEGDNFIGEGLTIGGTSYGDNNFRGQSGANLDILSWNVGASVSSASSTLNYTINTYAAGTPFGPAVDGLFDYVKVLKYNTCPPGCSEVSYQWTRNGVPAGNTQSIWVSVPGIYVVNVTDCSGGCVATDFVIVTECEEGGRYVVKPSITKEQDMAGAIRFSVQPNPGNSYFDLVMRSNDNTPATVRILDTYGKVMTVYQQVNTKTVFRIDAIKWASGVYFAEVIQGGKRTVLKMIKN